ncbi:hypothetical protein [Nocardia anaemiae]|uniref:hypothetical protein n=1 Tax=Nocardia anaemiae TaxID=263910 RepID=UPI000B279677|nr:hypothetical protein [Nocardia anaemiae]
MITSKTRGISTRRLLANITLIGAAMAAPMIALAVPAMAMPTTGPDVVQTDNPHCPGYGPGCKGWGGNGGWGGGWGGNGGRGGNGGWGWGGDWGDWGGGSSQWLFPPGWFGSS